jgi:two-component system sensor histidine kinase YesM
MLVDANALRIKSFIIAAVFLISACILFVIEMNKVTENIHLLVTKMSKVTNGKYEKIKETTWHDEIGIMTRSYNIMVDSLKTFIFFNYEKNLQLKEAAVKRKEAELYALQSQIQPHFLFNILESIRMKIKNGFYHEADTMIINLSKLWRKRLQWKGDTVTLREEIELTRNYLSIMQLRFKDKMKFTISSPKKSAVMRIPKFIIQPIVENAVRHGIENILHSGLIEVHVEFAAPFLKIIIRDNGQGIDKVKLRMIKDELNNAKRLPEHNMQYEHIGLKNVYDRINSYNGSIRIESEHGIGTTVTLQLHLSKIRNRERSTYENTNTDYWRKRQFSE